MYSTTINSIFCCWQCIFIILLSLNFSKDPKPEGIYNYQLVTSMGKIALFCSEDKTDQAQQFVQLVLGNSSTVEVYPTEPPRLLAGVDCNCKGICSCKCNTCLKGGCPSRNGNNRDKDRVGICVGSGSKILVLKTDTFNEIQNNLTDRSLQNIEKYCADKRVWCTIDPDKKEEKEKYRCYSSTVGCYKNIKGKDVIITSAHTINDMKPPLTFLSEVMEGQQIVTKVIGITSCGFYNFSKGLDILIIDACQDIQDYLDNTIRSKCTDEYLNIEPVFCDPAFEDDVTLRGATSGNLNGRVCTRQVCTVRVDNTSNDPKYEVIEAFAISSTVNESPIAQLGDSGAISFKSVTKETREARNGVSAYGIVSREATVVNELKNEISREVVCVKALKCVDFYMENHAHVEALRALNMQGESVVRRKSALSAQKNDIKLPSLPPIQL